MTPKENLKLLGKGFIIVDGKKTPIKNTNRYYFVEQALTELEELKRDVKRYFELDEKTMSYVILGREDECDEVERLKDKLLKVGKEE